MLREGTALPRLSDTSTESTGGGAAASLLAGIRSPASTKRIELRRGVLVVTLRARMSGSSWNFGGGLQVNDSQTVTASGT